MLLVDAANVVGARPDGWWRDRAGAAARLVGRIRKAAAAGAIPVPVVVVVEGAARSGVAEGEADHVEVVHAGGSGDATLAALAGGAATEDLVVLVSADRALRGRVKRPGVSSVGPNWLLSRLGPENRGPENRDQ